MDEFIGRCFFMLVFLIAGIMWAARKFAEINPDAAEATKKQAGAKALGLISKYLK